MKKALFIIVALLISLSLPTAAFAEEPGYENIGELYRYWSVNGTPEWVSSVYATEGSVSSLTVLLVNGYEDKEAELRSMLRDDSTLTVVLGGAYSEAAMLRVQGEIVAEYMVTPGKVASCGVGWAIINGAASGFGESGRESRVVVAVLEDYFEELKAELLDKYGDIVYVQAVSGYPTDLGASAEDASIGIIGSADGPTSIFISRGGAPDWVLIVSVLIILALAIAAVLFYVNRKKKNG